MQKSITVGRIRRGSARLFGLSLLVSSLAGTIVGAGTALASGSQVFTATGADQTFTVPAGVTEVQVYVRGAGGGSDTYGYYVGGKGAFVSATLQVTPGDSLTIKVGSLGSPSVASRTYGDGGAAGNTSWYTSQGGGASDIRVGGATASNRVIVAGGGGGSGSSGNGGNGGTPNGGNGLPTTNANMGGQGGFGATQAAGGTGGASAGGGCGSASGSNGASALGGNGAAGGGYSGSGGGGGYYGGGGGGGGCNSGSGGGGSSWADTSLASGITYALSAAVAAGCVEIVWPVAGAVAGSCVGAPDVTAPTLSTSSPADNASGVALAANLVLNFSENVSAVAAKNVIIKKSSDNSTFESIPATDARVTVSGSQVTVNPTGTFDYSTGYYVTIDAGAFKDAANNNYAGISSSTALNFTTLADSIPTLSTSTPADGATGVSLTANIALTFSEAVTAVAAKNIVIKESGGATFESIPATDARVTVSGSQVTVNPTGTFDYSTGYYVTIDAGAFRDATNNNYAGISSSTDLNFTTLADVVAPTLSSSTPADGATGVSLTANIVLNFSEAVTAVAAKNIVIKESGGATFESIPATDARVTVSGSQVTVNPTGTFDYLTDYYVTIDAGAFKDAANNNYAGISSSTTLNFSTDPDTTAPSLASSTPADNATGVSLTANIVLNFSEAVTAVASKNIVIKESGGATFESIPATDARVTVSGSQVTVNPTGTFDGVTSYYVTIDSGAFKDSANNGYAGISSSTALNFTTAAAPTTTTTSTVAAQTTTTTAAVSSGTTTTVLAGSSGVTTTTLAQAASVSAPSGGSSGQATTTSIPATGSIVIATSTTTPITASGTRTPVASSVPGAAPVAATTTTTTTTTTVSQRTRNAALAPEAPAVETGSASALVGGVEVQMNVSRENNTLTVAGAGLTMKMSAVLEDGTVVPLDPDGNIRLEETRLIQIDALGVGLNSEAEVWLYSDPVLLGTVAPNAAGEITARFAVPDNVPSGDHRLVVKARNQSGEDATIAVGIAVGASSGGVPIGWLITIPLMLAVGAALVIPARRRRRVAGAR